MTYFATAADELAATQAATEELLDEIASSIAPVSEHTVQRLERLAACCARLAYGNKLGELLSPSVEHLIAWCDHTNEPRYRAAFVRALRVRPLPPLDRCA